MHIAIAYFITPLRGELHAIRNVTHNVGTRFKNFSFPATIMLGIIKNKDCFTMFKFVFIAGILKKNTTSLNSQIEKKHSDVFGNERSKFTFQLHTKPTESYTESEYL